MLNEYIESRRQSNVWVQEFHISLWSMIYLLLKLKIYFYCFVMIVFSLRKLDLIIDAGANDCASSWYSTKIENKSRISNFVFIPGSGKTAAFLIPMFEKLHTHDAMVGMQYCSFATRICHSKWFWKIEKLSVPPMQAISLMQN